jgi:hypothetical protein
VRGKKAKSMLKMEKRKKKIEEAQPGPRSGELSFSF